MTALRIAILFEFPTLNGGERSMLAVIDRLRDQRMEFVALAPREGGVANEMSLRNIEHVPFEVRDHFGHRFPQDALCRQLLDAVARCSPDIVHANSLAMGRFVGRLSPRLAIPTVGHLRDILKLSRAAVADLNRNQRLLAVSAATRTFHCQQGLDEGRVSIVYNGIDCEQFQPRSPAGTLRGELGLPPESFLSATIGQIGLRKGQDVLAAAAVVIADRIPNAHFLLIGERFSSKAESIRFEESIFNSFAEAGIGHRLHRLGYRDDVPRLMNEIDVLVHPAHQEPFGRVLLEAAASGVPIIATDVGGTSELLTDGVSARLVPAGDPQVLAEALFEMYWHRDRAAQWAACAREVARTRFNIEDRCHDFARIWRDLAARAVS